MTLATLLVFAAGCTGEKPVSSEALTTPQAIAAALETNGIECRDLEIVVRRGEDPAGFYSGECLNGDDDLALFAFESPEQLDDWVVAAAQGCPDEASCVPAHLVLGDTWAVSVAYGGGLRQEIADAMPGKQRFDTN